jgi:hypothetical protein
VRLSRIQAIMGSNFAPQTGFLSVTWGNRRDCTSNYPTTASFYVIPN